MAEEISVVGGFTPDVGAAADLRTHQWKLVQFGAGGVKLAVNDQGSGGAFALWATANSGGFVTLAGAPNVVKAYADGAMVRGSWVKVSTNTSGWALAAGSAGSAGIVGVALSACASGSLFSLKLGVI